MTVTSLHERDFYGWVAEQCAALQAHDTAGSIGMGSGRSWRRWDARNTASW